MMDLINLVNEYGIRNGEGIDCTFSKTINMNSINSLNNDIMGMVNNNVTNNIETNIMNSIYNNTNIVNVTSETAITREDIITYNHVGLTVVLHPLQAHGIDVDGLDIVLSRKVQFDVESKAYRNLLIYSQPIRYELGKVQSDSDIRENVFTLKCEYKIDVTEECIIILNSRGGIK